IDADVSLLSLLAMPSSSSFPKDTHLTQNRVPSKTDAEIGREAVLSCPNISEVPLLVIWKRNRTSCLSYRRDLNKTSSLNCSERITWKYSPGRDPALRIYPVDLEDEGIYTCDLVNAEGNFQLLSSLIVIVPPTVTLTHDKSRVAVCQASAGKPAADISWIPASNHSSEEEFHHPNGTVTRVSYFGWANSSIPSVTCLVTHAAMNQTLVSLLNLKYIAISLLTMCRYKDMHFIVETSGGRQGLRKMFIHAHFGEVIIK
uniref:Ig-like domain-containing protein n=1 Tax=Zonotrichia albicollis TaxID=44394 RepID=A0A8D2N4L1_ZONAL